MHVHCVQYMDLIWVLWSVNLACNANLLVCCRIYGHPFFCVSRSFESKRIFWCKRPIFGTLRPDRFRCTEKRRKTNFRNYIYDIELYTYCRWHRRKLHFTCLWTKWMEASEKGCISHISLRPKPCHARYLILFKSCGKRCVHRMRQMQKTDTKISISKCKI